MGLTVGDAFQTSFSALALMCPTVVTGVNINKSVSSLLRRIHISIVVCWSFVTMKEIMMMKFSIILAVFISHKISGDESSRRQTKPRAETKFGVVEGTFRVSEPGSRTFSSFEGLAYAEPPTDSLRFQPPVTLPGDIFYSPDDPLVADQSRSQCCQIDQLSGEFSGSEDCLYLNVFTPETSFPPSHHHPVMVTT